MKDKDFILNYLEKSISQAKFSVAAMTKSLFFLPKKAPGTFRPVVPGEGLGKLVANGLKELIMPAAKEILGDFLQLGVMFSGGTSVAIHSALIAREVVRRREGKEMFLALLDFSNAFNSVSVEAVLAAVNRLKVSSTIKKALLTYLQSIQIVHDGKAFALLRGLCQGDVLSSLLFAVTIHPLVEKLHKDWGMLKLKTNESVEDSPTIVELPRTTSYLDDISVIVDSEDDYKKLL
ncbi:hypothetical protein ADUPG1_005370, partial [Aduncisulcus paluster]